MGAFGGIAGQILARVLVNRLLSSPNPQTGRWPHPKWGPVVLPRGKELADGETPEEKGPPFRIMTWGFLVGYAGLLYYVIKRSNRPQLGDQDLFTEREPEQKELFPKLRRELRLEQETPITSDDPVEACLEAHHNWNLDRVRELKASIDEKSIPDIFTGKTEKLTRSEEELLEDIDDCLERVRKQYGSLEAAGIELIPCALCGNGES